MDLLLALVAFEIIASKFLVSYISSNGPVVSYEEKNPLLRLMFKMLKMDHDAWISFFCTLLLTTVLVYLLASFYSATAYHILFILGGFYTTVLNLGAAHSSYFQKNNFITRRLLR
ncbi:hypothetical protein [Salinimicrobium sediminilitoris]|uniref:hypothetical protein n=1 Tax=Salinimicrobium sediminilitoris TaxID=2876715 RepID=UPI001E2F7915|nr:hypothetical protein [Salinimicrobium sediminilitoris]MCC8361334.1 hypothetical protein [Salinimicrobium sediminilitoris]